jgi:putrescine transport system ATP-binding protein
MFNGGSHLNFTPNKSAYFFKTKRPGDRMIKVSNISKSYGKEPVLKNIGFELLEQHTMSILGKSGCGKTTLLKILAGLENCDSGSFTIDGIDMLHMPPQRRGVVYLSQEPLLFPHMTVEQNIGYGLKIRKISQNELVEKVEVMLNELGISEHRNKMPDQLSGGQKQRVAFGRALVINPKVILLDEPFGSLDAHTREDMQALFLKIAELHHITALLVTHDVKEALIMGRKYARLDAGALTVYPDKKAFVAAPENGIEKEVGFWNELMKEHEQ